MDCRGAPVARGVENHLAPQVTFLRARTADVYRLVAGRNVRGMRVGVGKHRDGADTQAPRRARDAAGDFAAIGDQQLAEHRRLGYFLGGAQAWRTLFEECGDALAPFGRDARVGDALGRGCEQHIVHGRLDHVGQQALGGGQRRGARRQQLLHQAFDLGVECVRCAPPRAPGRARAHAPRRISPR